MVDVRLIHGDCIEEMQKLNDIEVDLVLTDLPYGTTACKWDNIIPFDKMWDGIRNVCHDRTAVLLFGNEPFSSTLRVSNLKCFKYDWVWNKETSSNFLSSKYMPLIPIEYVSVFYKKAPTFNPIRRKKTIDYDGSRLGEADKRSRFVSSDVSGATTISRYYEDDGYRHPINLITFNNQRGECNNSHRVHPTQKPVALLEYLIKTYTNEGDTVLDFTMGSGSTGVAAKGLKRNFIGIELDEEYFEIARKRINSVEMKLCS